MAKRWTDAWVRQLEHPGLGQPERVYRDPALNKHRLTVTRTRKIFEVQAKRPQQFGPTKTYVVQVGDALDCSVEEARKRAGVVLARIRAGEDPHGKPKIVATTLGSAWEEFQKRDDLRPRTLAMYKSAWKRCLSHLADTTLRHLVDNPRVALDLHKKITKERGPSEANHSMRLMRALYRFAARLDTSLPGDRHPCSAVRFHREMPRQGAAIPEEHMPAWAKQLEALRAASPSRAAFHTLCLRLGTRPGELARAQWDDVDWERKILTLPESKTVLVEVPLPTQAIPELRTLLENRVDGEHHVFPAAGKSGHLSRLTEEKDVLSHSGNSGRHTHHTLGVRLGIDDRILDPLEGRSLLKSGMAGRGYIDSTELGPEMRKAQQSINDRIDESLKAKAR